MNGTFCAEVEQEAREVAQAGLTALRLTGAQVSPNLGSPERYEYPSGEPFQQELSSRMLPPAIMRPVGPTAKEVPLV